MCVYAVDTSEFRLFAQSYKVLYTPSHLQSYIFISGIHIKPIFSSYSVGGPIPKILMLTNGFSRICRTIDRRKRLILAMDTAFGMEYLHEKNIVHFDLKSHNLLVNMRDPRRPVCKVIDLLFNI